MGGNTQGFSKGFSKKLQKLAVLFSSTGLPTGHFGTLLRTPYMIQVQHVSTVAGPSLPLHSSCLTLGVDCMWEWGSEYGAKHHKSRTVKQVTNSEDIKISAIT